VHRWPDRKPCRDTGRGALCGWVYDVPTNRIAPFLLPLAVPGERISPTIVDGLMANKVSHGPGASQSLLSTHSVAQMTRRRTLQWAALRLAQVGWDPVPHASRWLTVTTRATSDSQVEIEFADTGRGIPKEMLGEIFDPFFTTMPVGKGTGLGLSISYSIIKQHRRTIDVESRAGVGSTFTIRLPVKSDEKENSVG